MNNKMKFGLEVEFAGPFRHLSLVPKTFEIGTDATVLSSSHNLSRTHRGLELRSKTFEIFPAQDLKDTLKLIKFHQGHITSTCGTHIHFSGKKLNMRLLRKNLLQCIDNWEERDRWCRSENCYKYKVIRAVNPLDNHYEARIFNGTLNFRAICRYFKILLKCFEMQGFRYSIPGLN